MISDPYPFRKGTINQWLSWCPRIKDITIHQKKSCTSALWVFSNTLYFQDCVFWSKCKGIVGNNRVIKWRSQGDRSQQQYWLLLMSTSSIKRKHVNWVCSGFISRYFYHERIESCMHVKPCISSDLPQIYRVNGKCQIEFLLSLSRMVGAVWVGWNWTLWLCFAMLWRDI